MIKKLTEFLFYLLFLLTPLVMYKNTSELFEFNKIIFIYLIAILIFIVWIFKIGKEKKIIFKRTFLDIPILIFLLTQIISRFFSIDFYTSIFGFYGRPHKITRNVEIKDTFNKRSIFFKSKRLIN